jgi:hypothetical protein
MNLRFSLRLETLPNESVFALSLAYCEQAGELVGNTQFVREGCGFRASPQSLTVERLV